MDNQWQMAGRLAARYYATIVEPDSLLNGETVYFVRHPELPGCKAEGESIIEAMSNLDDARLDYIHMLLSGDFPVPQPMTQL
jgi:predicted RNase H-like HicB family nuclease